MAKADLAGFVDKVKKGSNDVVDVVKGTAEEIIIAAQKKSAKKADSVGKKTKPTKNNEEAQDNNSRAKLNEKLQCVIDQYNEAYTIMNDKGATLYMERTRAVDLIVHVENLINSIANHPKEFDTEIAEIKIHRETFTGVCEFAKAELEAAKKSALGAGAGVAAGAAVVSVAPTVAMWVATTFGTASTGTAISALSGAAATNAALAWLGGGALAACGGGMAAGNALLALAGPVGWGVAGVTLLSSIVLFSMNKLKMDKQKQEEIKSVAENTNVVQKTSAQIQTLLDEVLAWRENLGQQYEACLLGYGRNFMELPNDLQVRLGALVNNTKALSVLLGKSI